MSASSNIVVTLHCAGGLRSQVFQHLAESLPVQSMSAGFSQLILVLPLSALEMLKEFVGHVERLRDSDSAYKHLQIGVAQGILPDPLPHPMREEHPVVIEAFKSGLSPLKFYDEIAKIEHDVA